jgi:hypothetical protein
MTTSTHSFSCSETLKAKWSPYGFAIIDTGSGEINLHGHTTKANERLKRAVEAFGAIMNEAVEPVAQQQAAE